MTRLVARPVAALLLAAFALIACDDAGTDPPDPGAARLGVVLGSVDLSLTVFPLDTPDVTRTVGVGPDGTPVSFDLRDGLAIVPLGTVPAAAVVDVVAGSLLRTIPLPTGSGATGAAFLNDSVAYVGNPGLGSVSPVNVNAGTASAEIAVGVYPAAVSVVDGTVWVVDANLVNFSPAGPGALVGLDPAMGSVTDSIALSGTNPGSMVVGDDGSFYVLHSGNFGAGDGSLSVVDPGAGMEEAHHTGFGDFPGALAWGADGNLWVSSFSYGIAIWNPSSETFLVPPDSAVTPGGVASASGVAIDLDGAPWTLEPECGAPGHAFRLDATSRAVTDSVIAGVCPIHVRFESVDPG